MSVQSRVGRASQTSVLSSAATVVTTATESSKLGGDHIGSFLVSVQTPVECYNRGRGSNNVCAGDREGAQ